MLLPTSLQSVSVPVWTNDSPVTSPLLSSRVGVPRVGQCGNSPEPYYKWMAHLTAQVSVEEGTEERSRSERKNSFSLYLLLLLPWALRPDWLRPRRGRGDSQWLSEPCGHMQDLGTGQYHLSYFWFRAENSEWMWGARGGTVINLIHVTFETVEVKESRVTLLFLRGRKGPLPPLSSHPL